MDPHRFDEISLAALRARPGAKWQHYDADVLPLWVAEMDFPLAPPIKRAIEGLLARDDFGYPQFTGLPGLREAVNARLKARYAYATEPDQVMLLGSTGAGINLSVHAFTQPGDEVLLLTPLYPPFKQAVERAHRVAVEVEMIRGADQYEIDFAALERAVTPKTRLLMLCSPHNPVGRVFTRQELEGLADLAQRHDLVISSDDLHADILMEGKHIPIATLSPEVAERTVTLYGPTKAFNIPGLKITFAISSNPEIIKKLETAGAGIATGPNVAAQNAALAAYTDGDEWLNEALDYLRGNRDWLVSELREKLPQIPVHLPQGTYLAWLDLRGCGLGDTPAAELLERAKVALNEGSSFGPGGDGFARLNFATSRPILAEAVRRLEAALT